MSKITDSESPETEFHKLSVAAVLAAIFGTLTLTAFFFGPGMLLCAFLAVFLAVIFWYQNFKEPGVWAGHRFAWWGTLASIFAISGALSHEITSRQSMEQSARLVAEQWLTYHQAGNTGSTYELTRHPQARTFNADKLHETLSKDPEAQIAYDKYISQEAVAPLIASEKKLEWTFSQATVDGVSENIVRVNVYFNVTLHDKDQPRTVPLLISVNRSKEARTSSPQWTIVGIKNERPMRKVVHSDEQ